MALSPEEVTRATELKAQGFNTRQVSGFIAGERMGKTSTISESLPQAETVDSMISTANPQNNNSVEKDEGGFFSKGTSRFVDTLKDVPSDIRETGGNVISSLKRGVTNASESLMKSVRGERNPVLAGFDMVGDVAGGIGDAVGDVTMGAIKTVVNPDDEKVVAEKATEIATSIADTDMAQQMVQIYDGLDEDAKQNLRTTGNIGMAVVDVLTAGTGTKAVRPLVGVAERGIDAGIDASVRTGAKLNQLADQGADIAISGANKITEPIANVTRRGAVQRQVKADQKALVESLPSQKARTAAEDGVDFDDITTFENIPVENKSAYKELVDESYKFAAKDKTATDPAELIGTPIIKKLNEAEAVRKTIGKEQGRIASSQGRVKAETLKFNVLRSLQETPGLEGLAFRNGKLDFTNTNIGSSLSKKVQKDLQGYFDEAIGNTSGKRINLFREELRVVLGSKKGSLAPLLETEDKAIEAMRKGMANTLSPEYRAINLEYAKAASAISDFDKKFKLLDKEGIFDEDLLNMKAGNFARRMQSAASSGIDMKQLLRNLDTVTGTKGVSAEKMQEVYLVLDRYLQLEKGGTLSGRVESGGLRVASKLTPGGAAGAALAKLNEFGSITEGVTQKALKDYLDEILSI
jgi:hypothetical protein